MVGQGRYLVLIGTADFAVIARARQGVPVKIIDPRQLKEGSDVSSSNGNLAVFNRASHPNAAKSTPIGIFQKRGRRLSRALPAMSARGSMFPRIMPSLGWFRYRVRSRAMARRLWK